MLRGLSLYGRLAAVFVLLLLACFGTSVWLQTRSSTRYQEELTQRLSLGLAAHIAANSALMEQGGLNDAAVRDLFGKLMAVNPSVEVYLLAPDGGSGSTWRRCAACWRVRPCRSSATIRAVPIRARSSAPRR
jgi:hypothetical protein